MLLLTGSVARFPKRSLRLKVTPDFGANTSPEDVIKRQMSRDFAHSRASPSQFDEIFSCTGYDDRIAEIIASWDIWQEQAAANEREGVPQAEAVRS